MPIYEYRCDSCHALFEEMTSSVNKTTLPCIYCDGKAHRIISKSSFHLKGGGWYATEYGTKVSNTESVTTESSSAMDSSESTSTSSQSE